ncbi:MAG: lysylphosphatidylglycerol synthase domain-containing protein [bacterium]
MKERRRLWFGVRLLFAGTVLFFLAQSVVTRWSEIRAFGWDLKAGLLVGSILLQLAASVLWATVWWRMVVRTGCSVSWLAGTRIYMTSNLARYIPGSIWGYVSRAYLGKEDGVTPQGVGISVVWEIGSAVVASLFLVVTALPAYQSQVPAAVLGMVLTAALGCLIGLLPPVFNRWVPLLRPILPAHPLPSFSWMDFLLYLGSALGTHILVGTAFFLFARSLFDIGWSALWDFVVLWSFSATSGLLIIFVPYGLGVREGLLVILLRPFVPDEVAALMSLSSRVWTIFGELIGAGVAILVYHCLQQSRGDTP